MSTEPLTMSYRDVIAALGISERTFYRELASGRLDKLRVPMAGHKFSRAKVLEFVNGKPQQWKAAS